MLTSNFFDREIDDVSFENVKKAIGETPESRIRTIESLRKKLLKIEDLRPRLDSEFLLRFLRIAKFDVQKAYERIRKYYSVRRTYSHVFKYFYPTSPKTALITGYLLACPRRTADHSIVVILKRDMHDPVKMIYEEVFLMECLVMDFVCENPFTQVCGVHIILDFAGYNFQHLFQETPGRVRMILDTFQNSFPIKYKTINVINVPKLFSVLYNLYYPFSTAKIRKRLFLHTNNDWKTLHSIIPPELLPLDYGGIIPNTDLIDLADEIIKKDSQFKEHLQYGFVKKT